MDVVTWGIRRDDAGQLAVYVAARGPALARRQRQVYELCVARGMTLEQAAATLGIERPTVSIHLQRLRAAAKKWRDEQAATTAARQAA